MNAAPHNAAPARRHRLAGALRLMVVILVAVGAGYGLVRLLPGGSDRRTTLGIATGPEGGTYHQLGQQLAKILDRELQPIGLDFEARPTQGGLQNLVDIAAGSAHFGFVQGPVLDHFARTDPNADQIAVIGKVYPAYVQVVASEQFIKDLVNEHGAGRGGPERAPGWGPDIGLGEWAAMVRALAAEYGSAPREGPGESTGDDRQRQAHQEPNIQLNEVLDMVRELRARRSQFPCQIYFGPENSNSHFVAQSLLESYGFGESYYTRVAASGRETAHIKDIAGRMSGERRDVDIAFICAGIPTPVVTEALSAPSPGGARLLSVGRLGGLKDAIESGGVIRKWTYPKQDRDCTTIQVDEYLVCRADTPPETVVEVADALFDNLSDLLLSHKVVRQFRFDELLGLGDGRLPALPFHDRIGYHPGVLRFRERDRSKLLIATGPIDGDYYRIGRQITAVLARQEIECRVVPTAGSLENLALLAGDRPALGIVQRDAALASLWEQPDSIYKGRPRRVGPGDPDDAGPPPTDWEIPHVNRLGRLAALHEELLYALAPAGPSKGYEDLGEYLREGPGAGPDGEFTICLGVEGSGTSALSQAVLAQVFGEELPRSGMRLVHLPVEDMVNQLANKSVNLGFAMGGLRSRYRDRATNRGDDGIRQLPIDPPILGKLGGQALEAEPVDGTGASAGELAGLIRDVFGRGDSRTLKTRALLVANDRLDEHRGSGWSEPITYRVTRAVFEGAGLLPELDVEGLRADVPSVPLHPQAERYFKERGFLPPDERIDLWKVALAALGLFVSGLSARAGVLALWEQVITTRLSNEVLAVDLSASNREAVRQLRKFRQCARPPRRRFHFFGSVFASRWRTLGTLIDGSAAIATRNKLEDYTGRIALLADRLSEAPGDAAAVEGLARLRGQIRDDLVHGELESSQYQFLMGLLPAVPQAGGTPPEGPAAAPPPPEGPPDLPTVVEILADEDPGPRHRLWQMGQPAVGAVALAFSRARAEGFAPSQIRTVRERAAWLLYDFCHDTRRPDLGPAIGPLIEVIGRCDEPAYAVVAAVRVLGAITPYTPEIDGALEAAGRDARASVRRETRAARGKAADRPAVRAPERHAAGPPFGNAVDAEDGPGDRPAQPSVPVLAVSMAGVRVATGSGATSPSESGSEAGEEGSSEGAQEPVGARPWTSEASEA